MREIQEMLFAHQDEKYKQFHCKLVPNVKKETVIGVRTPILRKLAKEISKQDICEGFLAELPHAYFEENQLHGFLLSEIKDYSICLEKTEEFLPYINNWATCDQTSPKIFKKNREKLLHSIEKWLKSDHTYTVRFAIGMLMQHFLDEDFKPEYLQMVSDIKSQEYYINMEIAWFMATALAKQWDEAVVYIEKTKMDKWVHNKTIQKARESYRITKEQKEYLKQFAIR